MKQDPFSRCHPAVNFLYFMLAIGFGVVIQHPAYMLAAVLGSAVYSLLLKGRKGLKAIAFLLPVFLLIAAVNPLFNTLGETRLFTVFGRPYTLEALYYGAVVGGIFVVMMLWFGCYSDVLTSDKFTSLFGNLIPALSLLLVMVLRMIPNLLRKARQITACRGSIGKGVSSEDPTGQKLRGGMQILGALFGWALEGSMVTADSMRSRGYGTAKRSSFLLYRFRGKDWLLLSLFAALAAFVIFCAATGAVEATYTPSPSFAPLQGLHLFGFWAYCLFISIPALLHGKEALAWRISILKI